MADARTRPGSGSALSRHVPIVDWLPSYRREWLAGDALAGLSVWALLVPQGLAYAAIAGVPVQYGLYTGFAALIGYAVFGSTRHVVTGPSATVAAVTGVAIAPLVASSALGTDQAAPVAAALALVSGVICWTCPRTTSRRSCSTRTPSPSPTPTVRTS